MSYLKKYVILFAIYTFLVFSPFMFDGLNQIEPRLFGMPFTVWSIHAVIAAGCVLVYWGSVKAWDSFDDYHKKGDKQ